MGTKTGVNWCHHTFSPWYGCQEVSEGCRFCYARNDFSIKLRGIHWGPNARRVIKAESGWAEPYRWNRAAEKAGERRRVFCGSLCDVFEDRPELVHPRLRLFRAIHETLNLDYLLLTKRPESPALAEYWTPQWLYGPVPDLDERPWPPPNVWLGTTTENQAAADARTPLLLPIPAAVRFLSMEPLLGPVDLVHWFQSGTHCSDCGSTALGYAEAAPGLRLGNLPPLCCRCGGLTASPIHWVIVGGESGPNCRPFEWDWARSIRDQCRAAGVAFWMKQGGGHPHKRDRLEDLPEDLRIRELPR